MTLPVSAGFQSRIDLANQGIAGLPGLFNPRRRSLAFDTAAQLNEAGYTRDLMPEEVAEDGNLVYRLARAPDGRLYMQAYRQVGQQHSARGTFWSSFNQRDQVAQRRQLDAARNAIMRQFAQSQQGLTDQQADELRRMSGERAQAQADYADWQAQQPVAPPPAQNAANDPGNPGAAPGAPARPGTPSGWLWHGSARPDTSVLDQRFGKGQYRIVQPGAKAKWAVVRA